MQIEKYFVLNHDGKWKVQHNGKYIAIAATEGDAVKDAVRRAKAAYRDGRNSQVMVQTKGDSFRNERSYGDEA